MNQIIEFIYFSLVEMLSLRIGLSRPDEIYYESQFDNYLSYIIMKYIIYFSSMNHYIKVI
jgi:hypothetical protein